jgi:hypothetical protein
MTTLDAVMTVWFHLERMKLVLFDYPDDELKNTFTFDPKEHIWRSLMRQQDKSGKWSTFAEGHFRRTAAK